MDLDGGERDEMWSRERERERDERERCPPVCDEIRAMSSRRFRTRVTPSLSSSIFPEFFIENTLSV